MITSTDTISQPAWSKLPLSQYLQEADLASAIARPVVDNVIDYYCQTARHSTRARDYLSSRALLNEAALEIFKVGFADRTLGRYLPPPDTYDGSHLRGELQRSALLRPTGHEQLRGSIIFPFLDEEGHYQGAYGRRITPHLRAGSAYHVSCGDTQTRLFNHSVLNHLHDVILLKSPLEALTLWNLGFQNVVATCGIRGFSDEQLAALGKADVNRVDIAFDHSEEGHQASRLVAQALAAVGIPCRRVNWPEGMDANAFVCSGAVAKDISRCLEEAQLCRQTYRNLCRSRDA